MICLGNSTSAQIEIEDKAPSTCSRRSIYLRSLTTTVSNISSDLSLCAKLKMLKT